jgi:hypothetical protein
VALVSAITVVAMEAVFDLLLWRGPHLFNMAVGFLVIFVGFSLFLFVADRPMNGRPR